MKKKFCEVINMPWNELYQSVSDPFVTKASMLVQELKTGGFSKEELMTFFLTEPPLEFPEWLHVSMGVEGELTIKLWDKTSRNPSVYVSI